MDKMVETVEEAKDWVDHGMMNCGPQTEAAIRILRDHVDKIESGVAYQFVREETRKWLTETLQENADLASILADMEKRICDAGELHLADESTIYQLQKRVDELEHVVRGMVGWLTKNQPDVYSRGIWDAIARNPDE